MFWGHFSYTLKQCIFRFKISQMWLLKSTRSLPIGGTWQNAAPLIFTIFTDIQSYSLCVISSDWFCVKPLLNYSSLCHPHPPVQYLIAFCSRPEAASDVIDPTGVDVHIKLGDSRSNFSRDIRLPHFVMNDEWTTPAYAGHHIRLP